MSKTEHVVNLTLISDGAIKDIIANWALAISAISIRAKSLNKLRGIVNDLSNLSHNSLVEVDLIEHSMELSGHTGWGSEHTKDTIEVLALNRILVSSGFVVIDAFS